MRDSRDRDATHAEYLRTRPARYRGYARVSRYLTMRDGVRIAIDICLPRGLDATTKVPTILRQTRYFRRHQVHPLMAGVLGEAVVDPMNAPMRALFTSRGYAWVDVDARGSGASFGERPCPWYLEGEVADGAEIAQWIVSQPWSNGRIGSTGVSYEGTTADFLATTRHPAVKAIAPRFSLFDVYADVAFPGGLHSSYFTSAWEQSNAALDRNVPGEMVARVYSLQAHAMGDVRVLEQDSLPHRFARFVDAEGTQAFLKRAASWALGGVAPVDDDPGGEELARALASHSENFNVHEGAVHMTFRDDSPPNSPIAGRTSDDFSPHTYADRIDAAVLSYGGWNDGAYAGGAIKRFAAIGERAHLLVGPWIHGGLLDLDPDASGRRATFDHAAELLRFFDTHLVPELEGRHRQPKIRYYLQGEGAWREASSWPPPGTAAMELHLGAGRKLSSVPGTGLDVHAVDLTTRAGVRSRWRTLLCPFMHADGRGRSKDGWLVYEGAPLEEDLEITGSPVLCLSVASTAPDGAIIAYLEDVDAGGNGRLFTEGELRTIHQTALVEQPIPRVEVTYRRRDRLVLEPGQPALHAIELLPAAMRLRRGHRLRLILGGADLDHFTTPAAAGPVEWRIDLARSRLLLPVSGAAARPARRTL